MHPCNRNMKTLIGLSHNANRIWSTRVQPYFMNGKLLIHMKYIIQLIKFTQILATNRMSLLVLEILYSILTVEQHLNRDSGMCIPSVHNMEQRKVLAINSIFSQSLFCIFQSLGSMFHCYRYTKIPWQKLVLSCYRFVEIATCLQRFSGMYKIGVVKLTAWN